jgi:hypothetical protein
MYVFAGVVDMRVDLLGAAMGRRRSFHFDET